MPAIFIKPVRFCKQFPAVTIRNELFAMGYHNAAKERAISIDKLLGSLSRTILNELAMRLSKQKDQANLALYNSAPWGG